MLPSLIILPLLYSLFFYKYDWRKKIKQKIRWKKTHHINKANWLPLFITTNIILRNTYRSKSIWFNWWLIVWLQIGILNSPQGGVECRHHFWGDSIHCPLLCSVFVTIICTGFQHKESLISASRQDLFNSVSIHKKRGNGKSSPS